MEYCRLGMGPRCWRMREGVEHERPILTNAIPGPLLSTYFSRPLAAAPEKTETKEHAAITLISNSAFA